jgi:hypothetical protein
VTLCTSKTPLISTVFYLDGDVLHQLNELPDGTIPAEEHAGLTAQHMKMVHENVQYLKVFYTQIQAILLIVIALVCFFYSANIYTFSESLAIALGTSGLALLRRGWIAQPVLWVLKMPLRIYFRRYTRQWLA